MTSVPDYISPIVSYRAWQWGDSGLRSLNGEQWLPGKPLEAICRACDFAQRKGRNAHSSPRDAPHLKCTCGIYASKSREHLLRLCYKTSLIYGQVLLWGTVIEHQHGWRAQYAYPKSFLLPAEVLPVTFLEIVARLRALIAYRCDIFIIHDVASRSLWKEDSGFVADGLDYLMNRGIRWYTQHNEGSAIKQGDRVAIVGLGTAVVEEIDGAGIRARLKDKSVVRIARKRFCWNRHNVRWETNTLACSEPDRQG